MAAPGSNHYVMSEFHSFPQVATARSWIVVFTSALFFFYEFMQLNMFNAINPGLIKDFSINAAQLGAISAGYFYANIIFLFPAGVVLDRFSTRRIILAAMVLSVVSTFVFSFSDSIWLATTCRFITGIGGSFCLLSSVRLATRWFPTRRMALVIGLIVTMAMLGGIVSQTPLTMLTEYLGWRKALLIDASFGFAILIAIYLFVHDYPEGLGRAYDSQHAHLRMLGFGRTLWVAVRNLQNWLAGFYTSFMNLPIFLLGAIWGGLYLVQVHHLTRAQASYVTSMIFLGTIIGSPVLGWFSDRIAKRILPMLVCAIISLVFMLILMFTPHLSLGALMFLFFVIGFFTSAQIISYPLIAESNTPALTATAEGLASTLIMAGGLSQPFFGWLMDLYWNHTMVEGIPQFTVGDYRLALAVMPIAFVLSILITFLLKETHCKMKI